MAGRAATLQDVAELAGVSRATASLGLRDRGRMSAATRARIRAAAAELDYVANATARSLRTSRSGTVGLYVPDHTLSFRYYMDVAFGAVERAQAEDVLVTLMPAAYSPRSGIPRHLDGFIVIDPTDDDPVVAGLLDGDAPVVSGELPPPAMTAPFGVVHSDHVVGIRTILDHLWEQGSRRPAAILADRAMAWGRQTQDGYAAWCRERGVEPRLVETSTRMTFAELGTQVAALVEDLDGVDAVIGGVEGTVLVVAEAIAAAGLRVGEDLLLAAYVDSDSLAVVQPSITALDLQPREFGRQCMRLLAGALDGSIEPGTSVEVPTRLVVRESTRAVAVG
ncbi:LacI family DNA-binding transcriptional regulator [Agromyces sp. MMS24-JH15]|uniref:LacI family DNA-binding transcriptional regulator n=1 Tax=Agromyces sp. MMS24-JH15 TaxID=3243765 RepID=UPI00374A173A